MYGGIDPSLPCLSVDLERLNVSLHYDIETLPYHLWEWNPLVTGGFPLQRASDADIFSFFVSLDKV